MGKQRAIADLADVGVQQVDRRARRLAQIELVLGVDASSAAVFFRPRHGRRQWVLSVLT